MKVLTVIEGNGKELYKELMPYLNYRVRVEVTDFKKPNSQNLVVKGHLYKTRIESYTRDSIVAATNVTIDEIGNPTGLKGTSYASRWAITLNSYNYIITVFED